MTNCLSTRTVEIFAPGLAEQPASNRLVGLEVYMGDKSLMMEHFYT